MSVSVDLAQLALEKETHLAWTNTEMLAGCRVINTYCRSRHTESRNAGLAVSRTPYTFPSFVPGSEARVLVQGLQRLEILASLGLNPHMMRGCAWRGAYRLPR